MESTNTQLTVDDLIMEIGRMHVEKLSLNTEKFLLQQEIAKSKQKMLEITKKEEELLKKEITIKKSNELYQKNNERLDMALVDVRNINEKKTLEIDKLKKTITGLKKRKSSGTKSLIKNK